MSIENLKRQLLKKSKPTRIYSTHKIVPNIDINADHLSVLVIYVSYLCGFNGVPDHRQNILLRRLAGHCRSED
ncbi:hypothetical protein KUTeg_004837 [Tegillarca granosa]|uniref:Uncharacterized protein n=1 Tax=Tegillarca granosa TaxID=220873 RepID=A0ABQ9FMJ5_TEGGR|nr:hypothetical protein KUTeg_004837 [Tegillarca granosa]